MSGEIRRRDRLAKGALAAAFAALTVAILRARAAPAGDYEVTIIGATPPAVWVALAFAALVGVVVTLVGVRGAARPLGLALVPATVATTVALPLIRNYHAFGIHDALTHMGWARGILTGEMSALAIVYPGAHVATSMIAAATGVHLGRAMLLVVVGMTLLFLVFVPLVLRTLTGDWGAVVAGTFSAVLLMPITNVSTFFDFHSFTLATFFFPLLLFLLFKYLADDRPRSGLENALSSTGMLLVLGGIATDLYHPQVAVNMLVLFATAVGVQRLYRWLPGSGPLDGARSLLVPTVLIAAFFVAWTLRYDIVYNMLGAVVESLQLFLDGEAGPGQVVSDRGESAEGLGVSLAELFWKLFLVKAVYVALSVGLVWAWLAGRLAADRPQRNAGVTYIAYGSVALMPVFASHLLGDVSGYFFRYVGFGMMLATVLGAIALHALQQRVLEADLGAWLRPVAVVVTVVALVLSLAVVFPTPYIYKPTPHVTEASMSGHGMIFENANVEDDVRFTGLEPAPDRFADGLRYDILQFDPVPPEYMAANNLTEYGAGFRGDTPYYFTVTDHNYGFEVVAHRGHEYDRAAFVNVGTEFGVSRIQANGDLTVYHVIGAETDGPDTNDVEAPPGTATANRAGPNRT